MWQEKEDGEEETEEDEEEESKKKEEKEERKRKRSEMTLRWRFSSVSTHGLTKASYGRLYPNHLASQIRRLYQYTGGQNNQKYRLKYSSAFSHRLWESGRLNGYFFCVFFYSGP